MDSRLLTLLTLFAHGSAPYVIVSCSELPAAAAYLAIAWVDDYHVEPIVLDGEEWFQLSPSSEPLWAAPPPLEHTTCH